MEDDCNQGTICNWRRSSRGLMCSPSARPGCRHAIFFEAEESEFHDKNLIEATTKIREALKSIEPDPDGRELTFVFANEGMLLAWVEHGKNEPIENLVNAKGFEKVITPDDDELTVASALGLKNYSIKID